MSIKVFDYNWISIATTPDDWHMAGQLRQITWVHCHPSQPGQCAHVIIESAPPPPPIEDVLAFISHQSVKINICLSKNKGQMYEIVLCDKSLDLICMIP